MRTRRRRRVAIVVGVCAIALALGAAGKACRAFWDDPASLVCHSDLRALYPVRGLDRDLFPYLHGELLLVREPGSPSRTLLFPVGGANEYPVLTGMLMWLPTLVAESSDTYLLASVVLLAPFGLAAAWGLGRMAPDRALLWSASPILVVYAFHNWDLPVVAASVAGIWCWWRGRPAAAAVCFGVGGALKLYPLLFLAPLVLERLHVGDRRGAARAGVAGVGSTIVINLPILVLSPSGWALAYRALGLRRPNHDGLWGVLAEALDLGRDRVTVWATIAVIAVVAAAVWATLRRARAEGTYPFLPACAALLTGLLLVSKVHSPQFALWLLPFFVLVRVRTAWYVAFVVGNLVLFAAVFGVSAWSIHARDVLVMWSVWARTGTFLLLLLAFLRAPSAIAKVQARDGSMVGADPAD